MLCEVCKAQGFGEMDGAVGLRVRVCGSGRCSRGLNPKPSTLKPNP